MKTLFIDNMLVALAIFNRSATAARIETLNDCLRVVFETPVSLGKDELRVLRESGWRVDDFGQWLHDCSRM